PIPFSLLTSKFSKGKKTAAALEAFVKEAASNPVNATAFSTPSTSKAISNTSCMTLSVLVKDDPGGNCTKVIKYCWSMAGINPLATLLNSKPVSATSPPYTTNTTTAILINF